MDDLSKCGCGDDVRYTHVVDGVTVSSCNKHCVCPTCSDLRMALEACKMRSKIYREALQTIVKVNAMDYEYKAWAKSALDAD